MPKLASSQILATPNAARAAGRYPAAVVIAAIVLLIAIATFYR